MTGTTSLLPPLGIDHLLTDEDTLAPLKGKRVALLSNQAALTQEYIPSAFALQRALGPALLCLLSPEHGFGAALPEGAKVEHYTDFLLKLPVFSLYGAQIPATITALQDLSIDTIIVDLQDLGVTCYTYIATALQLIEALYDHPVHFILCDRPNPLGPGIQGPPRNPAFKSLVGYLDEPYQHGKTLGALLKKHAPQGTTLTLINCEPFHQPGSYPWIPPSPNLPTWESVLLYPGLVLLEGTTLSLGRGTSLPFCCVGAPDLNPVDLCAYLNTLDLGIKARALTFTPTTSVHKDRACQGAQIHIVDSASLNAFKLGIHLLWYLRHHFPPFQWLTNQNNLNKTPGYFIDRLLCSSTVREKVDAKKSPQEILKGIMVN